MHNFFKGYLINVQVIINFKWMRNSFLVFVVLLCSLSLVAQQESEVIPVSVGVYCPYVFQPGIKIGTAVNLKKWEVEKGDRIKSRSLFTSPQIGLFVRPQNHNSYVLNLDLGYKIKSNKRRIYIAPSLGLAYLMADQILSTTVDLSNGNIVEKDREIRNYFLPTINFELGNEKNKKIGWYTKLSYGRKISSQIEDSGFFALELGLKFFIRKREQL